MSMVPATCGWSPALEQEATLASAEAFPWKGPLIVITVVYCVGVLTGCFWAKWLLIGQSPAAVPSPAPPSPPAPLQPVGAVAGTQVASTQVDWDEDGYEMATRTVLTQAPAVYQWWRSEPRFHALPDRSHGAWAEPN